MFRPGPRLFALEDRTAPALLAVTSSADSGPGSLRTLVATAAANGEDDTITFAGVTAVTLVSGQIEYAGEAMNLTISGPGVTINGAGFASDANRLFNFNVPGGNPTITLAGLTLAKGNLTAGSNGGAILFDNDPLVLDGVTFTNNITAANGGAVASAASAKAQLTVVNSTFTANAANRGGAIFAGYYGSLKLALTATTISANTATSTGGGLSFGGSTTITLANANLQANKSAGGGALFASVGLDLQMTDSVVADNLATGGGGGGFLFNNTFTSALILRSSVTGNAAQAGPGGGVSFGAGGSLELADSTFSGNSASGTGGGLATGSGTAIITNSTFSGNTASGTGGGGFSINGGGSADIRNSTFTGNAAPNGSGGGVRKSSATGTLSLSSTIVAGNTAKTSAPDIVTPVGTAIDGKNNLVGVADSGGFFLDPANQFGTLAAPLDPLLAPLTANKGPTRTHALILGSPALNAGNNDQFLSFDQRGPGFPRVVDGLPDVGAFEGLSVIPLAVAVLPAVPPADATYTATVIYSDETGIDVSTIDVNDVTLSGPAFPQAVSPTGFGVSGGGTSVTATYTFTPPGGDWEFTDNGQYTLTLQPDQVFDTDAPPNAVPGGPLGGFKVSMPLPPQVVDNTGDADDGNYGPGQLTLREAINKANAAVGTAETITFSPGLAGKTITLTSVLKITDPLTVTGPGAAKLTVSGGSLVQIFDVNSTVAGASVTVSGLTLVNGRGTNGGALAAQDEAVFLIGCVLSGNSTTSSGGAVSLNGGTLTVEACRFDNNSSNAGGAIVVQNGSGLIVTDSLFTNNKTTGGNAGGAVRVLGTGGAAGVNIRNSTFAGNVSNFRGGAVGFASGFTGQALIQNCTIVNNAADADGPVGTDGGGVGAISGLTGTVVIESCIVWGNTSGTAKVASDLAGSNNFTAKVSLIGTSAGASSFTADAVTKSLLGTNPQLEALADNGGPTQTIALNSKSPALDAGGNPANLLNDQRGPGFARKSGVGVDIGAFELQVVSPITALVQVDDGTAQRSVLRSFIVTFSEPPNFPNGIANAFQLQRTGPASGFASGLPTGPVSLVATNLGNNVVSLTFNDLTFTEGKGSLIDGNYALTLFANNISGVGGKLDGNGDGIGGDNQVVTTFRLFGDGNGDRSVNFTDFLAFRSTFGATGPNPPYNRVFDFDGNNTVDFNDFLAFRTRFGATLGTP